MKPCQFIGRLMLFLVFAFLIAFGRDYSHSQETLEEKAGQLLVELCGWYVVDSFL